MVFHVFHGVTGIKLHKAEYNHCFFCFFYSGPGGCKGEQSVLCEVKDVLLTHHCYNKSDPSIRAAAAGLRGEGTSFWSLSFSVCLYLKRDGNVCLVSDQSLTSVGYCQAIIKAAAAGVGADCIAIT